MADKMDTRVPHLPGREDFFAFVRFLDNRKEFEKYVKVLDERTAAFLKATETYGKGKDIERLHAQAESLALRAQGAFEDRENKLVNGEKNLAKDDKEKRAVLLDIEQRAQSVHRKRDGELRVREAAVKVREDEVGNLEQVAAKAETVAQAKALGAVEAKREADAMVERMKVAVVPANG